MTSINKFQGVQTLGQTAATPLEQPLLLVFCENEQENLFKHTHTRTA